MWFDKQLTMLTDVWEACCIILGERRMTMGFKRASKDDLLKHSGDILLKVYLTHFLYCLNVEVVIQVVNLCSVKN